MDVCELLNVLSYGFTGTVHGSRRSYSWIPATGFFPFTRPYAIRYVDGLAIGFLRGCMLPATPLW
jgi:hypothetical protein